MNRWRKSTKCHVNGDCVEVAADGGLLLVRDSTDPEGPVLSVSPEQLAILCQ